MDDLSRFQLGDPAPEDEAQLIGQREGHEPRVDRHSMTRRRDQHEPSDRLVVHDHRQVDAFTGSS